MDGTPLDAIAPLGPTSTPEPRYSPYSQGKGSLTPAIGTSALASIKGYSLATTKGVPKEYNSAVKIIGLLEDFAHEHSVLADVSAWLEVARKRRVKHVRFSVY